MGVFISDDEMHALLFPEDPEPAADAAKKEGQEAERKEEVVTTPTTAKPKTKLTRASRKMYALIIGALPEFTSKFIVGTAEGDGLAVWQQLSQEYERSKPANVVDMLAEVFDLKFVREKSLQEDFATYAALWHDKFTAVEAARPREPPIASDIKMAALLKGLRGHEEYSSTLDLIKALSADIPRALELLKAKEGSAVKRRQHDKKIEHF